MFDEEAKKYSVNPKIDYRKISIDLVQQAFKDGAEYGYNIGYRKAMTIRTEIEQAEKDKVVKL